MTLNRRLAAIALTLGALAVFADVERGPALAFHEREMLTTIQREADHMSASDLAAWIVEGRTHYRLIDLRAEKAYDEYHIPTAEHVSLASLAEAGFPPAETLVLYSDGGIHAAQAWMLLRARGHRAVLTLRGGLDEWKDTVLFPAPGDARAAAVAAFFGGHPRGSDGVRPAIPLPALPKVDAPRSGGSPPPRRKKEGC